MIDLRGVISVSGKRDTLMGLNVLKILDKNHDCEILFPEAMYSRSY